MANIKEANFLHAEISNEHFASDVIDLFHENKAGHLGQWEYSEPLFTNDSVRGEELWRKFLHDYTYDYYILPNEIRLIQETAFSVADIIGTYPSVIELGPGSKEAVYFKTIPMLKGFLKPQSYTAVDLVVKYLKGVKRIIPALFDECSVQTFKKDFFESDFDLPDYEHPVMMMFGGTICNLSGFPNNGFSINETILLLRKLRSLLNNDGYFVITQDTNQDPISIERAYAGQTDFALNLLHRIKRDTKVVGDFDPESFVFKPMWFSKSYSLAHTFTVQKNMNFSVNGHDVSLKKDQILYFNNSYKYPSELFKKMAAMAGFKPLETFFDKDKRIALHLLKAV